jgi:predicted permease
MSTLQTTLPIFLLIAIGYLLRAKNIAKTSWISVLNGFVYYISLPALVLNSFSAISWQQPEIRSALSDSLAYLFVSAAVVFLISLLLRTSNTNKAAFFMTATVANSVYLGIPLANNAYGTSNAELITLIAVVQLVGSMLISLFMLEFYYLGTKNLHIVAKKFALNPLFISMVVGITLSLINFPSSLWGYVEPSIKMLALTASPVALFALGSFLHGHLGSRKVALLVSVVAIKLLLDPLLAYVVSRKLGAGTTITDITVLMAAMPTAVTAFILAKAYKLNTTFVANAMLASTVVSVLTTTVLIHFSL